MAARNQQHQIGEGQLIGQSRRQGMARQMIHAHKRQTGAGGQTLGQHHTRQNTPDQARTCRHRNAVQIGRFVFLNQPSDRLSEALKRRGFEVVGLDLSEFLKAGGSAKCLTLRLN